MASAKQGRLHRQREVVLGRLTGGVAHEFNNVLGVISNSLYLIEQQAQAPGLNPSLAAIRRSVEAGSRLTQHLLRLAGRQAAAPTTLQLSQWLPDMADMLRSLLGRHVVTRVQVETDTAAVHVDAGALELVLLDLVLDAREAWADTPSGARLGLGARNARAAEHQGLPGAPLARYVTITVSDEGLGTGVSWCVPAAASTAAQDDLGAPRPN